MRYKNLLFDVDNTLLDFEAAETAALRSLFQEMQLTLTPESEQLYQLMNKKRWQAHEKGELSSSQVVNGRFGPFFASLGKVVDSVATEEKYRHYLNQGHQLLGDSLPVIQQLAEQADLYVVTNGLVDTQIKRLRASGLLPYFKALFISDQIGIQKPAVGFFDYVFDHIPDFNKEETVIIGDSLTSDIQGGINAGIDTVWLNLSKTSPTVDPEPTFQITALEEIFSVFANS